MSDHDIWCGQCAFKIQNNLICNNPASTYYKQLVPIRGCDVGVLNKPIPENCLKGVYK